MAPHRRQTGFTLIELLLVLTIIALASVLVVPNLGSLDNQNFGAEVRQAAALLNYTRRLAIVSGNPSLAKFSLHGDPSAVEDVAPESRDQAGQWRSRGSAVSYRTSDGKDLEGEDVIEIIFFPEGGSTGGEFTLHYGERSAVISIDSFTGKVTVAYDNDIRS